MIIIIIKEFLTKKQLDSFKENETIIKQNATPWEFPESSYKIIRVRDGVIKEDVLDLDVLEELISYSLSNSSLSSTTSNSVMTTSFLSLSLFSTE